MLFLSLQKLIFTELPVDGIELRLDCFPSIDKQAIGLFCQSLNIPVLFTLRKGSLSDEERYALLQDLLSLEPDFVDLEYDFPFLSQIAKQFPKTKIILSYHNFAETPHNLEEILERMASPFAYAYKLATMANSSLDALRMLGFVRNQKSKKLTGLCMGKEGAITRILGPVYGNFIDFTALENELTAPGQLSATDLGIYNYPMLNSSTAVYGLIGFPIDKSFGHLTHNAAMRHYGWNAVYVKMNVQPQKLSVFFSLAKELGIAGLSVTMPLKELVIPHLDEIDADAKKIGAVNTIQIQDKLLYGYNTDKNGALNALEDKISVKNKKLILVGAGGAARAIAYEAIKRGADVLILNRTKAKAMLLAQELNCKGGGLEDLPSSGYDIVVNATPDCPELNLLTGITVMDIQNRPKITSFLLQAGSSSVVHGYEMFVYQALEQFQIWFNKTASPAFLSQECLKYIDN